MWVFDEDVGLNCRDVTFVPGLYKIFDEILGKMTLFLYCCLIIRVFLNLQEETELNSRTRQACSYLVALLTD